MGTRLTSVLQGNRQLTQLTTDEFLLCPSEVEQRSTHHATRHRGVEAQSTPGQHAGHST